MTINKEKKIFGGGFAQHSRINTIDSTSKPYEYTNCNNSQNIIFKAENLDDHERKIINNLLKKKLLSPRGNLSLSKHKL